MTLQVESGVPLADALTVILDPFGIEAYVGMQNALSVSLAVVVYIVVIFSPIEISVAAPIPTSMVQ